MDGIELLIVGQPFHGDGAVAVGLDRQHQAGIDRLAIEQHGARAAFALGAAVLRACEHQLLARHLQVDGDRATFHFIGKHRVEQHKVVVDDGIAALMKAGFDTLVEAGYQPEIAYFEVLHELKLITDLIQETGISGMRRRVSNTACYGDLTRGPMIITEKTRKVMKKLLKEIKSGKFAREWIKENEAGRPRFNKLLEDGDKHLIEEVGRKLREMMPWMKK